MRYNQKRIYWTSIIHFIEEKQKYINQMFLKDIRTPIDLVSICFIAVTFMCALQTNKKWFLIKSFSHIQV